MTQAITLTIDDYEAIGGLDNALNKHADEVLARVSPTLGSESGRTAERLFRALVIGSSPAEAIRRPAPLSELADVELFD